MKLKPCPFCGGEAQALFVDEYGTECGYEGKEVDGDVTPYIHCYGCDSEWFSDMDDPIEAWNKRVGEAECSK